MKKLLFVLLLIVPMFVIGQDVLDTELKQELEFKPAYYDTLGNLYGFFGVKEYIPQPRYDELRKKWYSYKTIGVQQTKTSEQWYYPYVDEKGVERRRYLGWVHTGSYEGCTIFSNKDTTRFWIWQISEETKLPYKIDVPAFIIKTTADN